MSDAPRKPPIVAQPRSALQAIIPQTIEDVYRLSQYVAAAGFAPKSYLVKANDANSGYSVEKIAVGIMHGLEVGLTPMAALQSIAVINGTPSIWGDGALALVMSSGLLEAHDEVPIYPSDGSTKVIGYTCTMRRKGRENPIIRSFTLEQAVKAKLTSKAGPWTEYPDRMMMMRARAWCMRDGFADVLRGLSIREEVEDYVRNEDGSYSPAPKKTAKSDLDRFASAPALPPTQQQPAAAASPDQAAADEPADGGSPPLDPSPPVQTIDPETGEIIDEAPSPDVPAMPDDVAASWLNGKRWLPWLKWFKSNHEAWSAEQIRALAKRDAEVLKPIRAHANYGPDIDMILAEAGHVDG